MIGVWRLVSRIRRRAASAVSWGSMSRCAQRARPRGASASPFRRGRARGREVGRAVFLWCESGFFLSLAFAVRVFFRVNNTLKPWLRHTQEAWAMAGGTLWPWARWPRPHLSDPAINAASRPCGHLSQPCMATTTPRRSSGSIDAEKNTTLTSS